MPCSLRERVTKFTVEFPWIPEDDKPLVTGEDLRLW